jgi:hypothetical protein
MKNKDYKYNYYYTYKLYLYFIMNPELLDFLEQENIANYAKKLKDFCLSGDIINAKKIFSFGPHCNALEYCENSLENCSDWAIDRKKELNNTYLFLKDIYEDYGWELKIPEKSKICDNNENVSI